MQMEKVARLYRKFVKHPFESCNLDFRENAFDLLVLCIAYTRVILQRSGLTSGAELASAINMNLAYVRDYRYHKSLDALGWARNSYFSTSRGNDYRGQRGTNQDQDNYLNVSAQLLVLNNANSSTFGHSFHVLSPSPLPVSFSLALGSVVLTILLALRGTFHDTWFFNLFALVSLSVFVGIIVIWFILVGREEYSGAHTLEVQQSFRIGIVLFIASEFMLFVAFFWAFFHFSLNPSAYTGCQFVPQGVVPFFWFRIPLVNTVILLSSGLSLTLAHGWLNIHDRGLRTRGWLQVLISGIFLTKNPQHEFVAFADSKLLPRTTQFHQTYAYGFAFPGNSWLVEWYSVFMGDSVPAAATNNFWSRWYNRTATPNLGFPLFRWSDDCRVYNALGYAYANLHDINVNTEYDTLPARTTNVLVPVSFRDESSEICSVYEMKNAYEMTYRNPFLWLADTIIRGFIFLSLQAYEYITGLFTIADSVFGAVFYTLTGLHGLHVFIGVLMLCGALWYNCNTSPNAEQEFIYGQDKEDAGFEIGEFYYTPNADMVRSGHFYARPRVGRFFSWWNHRVAFDGVAWYWHFVDVVWLFVFIFVYWYSFPTYLVIA